MKDIFSSHLEHVKKWLFLVLVWGHHWLGKYNGFTPDFIPINREEQKYYWKKNIFLKKDLTDLRMK